MINKKFNKNAFTIAEILVTLSVIGVVTALSIGLTINSETTKNTKISVISKSFYASIVSAFQDIIMTNTKDYSIDNLDTTEDKPVFLAKKFAEKLDGEYMGKSSCAGLNPSGANITTDELYCVRMKSNIMAGIYYDESCSTSVRVLEYFETPNSLTAKQYSNTCGYVVYGFINGTTFGREVFTIAFGKRQVK